MRKRTNYLKKVSVSSLKTNQFIKQLFRKKMNSVTTQLLKKSKTEEGLKTLNRELQDIRSRQEDNYYEYYYGGHYRDKEFDWKEEGDGIVRKRWERDQELLKSFQELFTWDEKFRYEIPYKIASYDPIKFQSKWSDDKKVAVNVTQNQGKYRPDDIENSARLYISFTSASLYPFLSP